MRYSKRIKPLSYLVENAEEVLAELRDTQEPLIITQNGEAKAILQDIYSYEEVQESIALLKIIILAQKEVHEGKVTPLEDVIFRLKNRINPSS